MARALLHIDFPPPTEDPEHAVIIEVPPTHPLRAYTNAMAAKLHLAYQPRLFLSAEHEPQGYATPRHTDPTRSYITLTKPLLEHGPPLAIAYILAHELGHLTPENTYERKPHLREYMADACAAHILSPNKAAMGFRLFMESLSAERWERNQTDRASHPSMHARIHAMQTEAWLHTCLCGISIRKHQQEELEAHRRAIAELRQRTTTSQTREA